MCEFTQGQPVSHRDRKFSNSRLKRHIQHWSIDISIGIWPVQDDELFAVFGSGLHHIVERVNIGIEATTYVLAVEYHQVNVPKIFTGRLSFFAIEGNDFKTGFWIQLIVYHGTIACVSTKAV